MSTETLRSLRHPKLRRLRELARAPAARIEAGLFLLEGAAPIQEALAAGAVVEELLVTARLESEPPGRRLLRSASEAGVAIVRVEASALRRAAPTEHGRGVVALVRLPPWRSDPDAILAHPGALLVGLAVQDPGNVGSMVRTAEAFGAGGVLLDGSCADPWGPKASRAAAGALVRLPVCRGGQAEALVTRLRASGRRAVAAVARGGASPGSVGLGRDCGLLLGSEGGGLPAPIVDLADALVTLPLARGVDSLGVAAAAAVLLYEAMRESEGRSGG